MLSGLFAAALCASGCDSAAVAPAPHKTAGALGFACPQAGQSRAFLMTDKAQRLTGPDALGDVGDAVLANERAAFVIQNPANPRTYYYYGGILIDAVALDNCRQAAPERFGELGVLMGKLDAAEFGQSILRTFRGESFEFLNDGKDGKAAIVRVHGTDDWFWLVELELIRKAFLSGKPKPPSAPLGIATAVDYILEPGSNVLRIEVHFENQKAEAQELLAGIALFLSDTTPATAYSGGKLNFGGFGLETGVPWIEAGVDDGAYAVALNTTQMATANISGVDAVLDLDQIGAPLHMEPKGKDDKVTLQVFVAVGGGDGNTAARHLASLAPGGVPWGTAHIEGRTTEALDGKPVAHAEVRLARKTDAGLWRVFDVVHSDAEGRFSAEVPDMGDAGQTFQLLAHLDGRPDPAPQTFVAHVGGTFELAFAPGGAVGYEILDDAGKPLPAKIFFYQAGKLVQRTYVTSGKGEVRLPPGTYDVSVMRGIEYGLHEGQVTVAPLQTTALHVTLPHLIDTAGFLCMDGHVHAAPSMDSTVSLSERFATAAAEGLEVIVHTEHEIIVDPLPALKASGVQGKVAAVVGEEVTATSPEHTNMYGVPLHPDAIRGDPVKWFGLDLAQIFAAEKARGAQIRSLNHPRGYNPGECSYMCLIRWNRLTGKPDLEDPTLLGLPKGAQLWSWDFEVVEYMNGLRGVFPDPNDPHRMGSFDDWMAFQNHGHRITAVGVTDVHGYDAPGSPRTYFAAPTDDPAKFSQGDLMDSLRQGRALVSAGAFARVQVNGKAGLGATVTDTDGNVEVHVRIEAIPQIDVTHVKIFRNCDQVADLPATDPGGVVKLDTTVPIAVSQDAHLVVVAFGSQPMPRAMEQADALRVPRVTTNPIYIDADGNGSFQAPGGKPCSYTLDASK